MALLPISDDLIPHLTNAECAFTKSVSCLEVGEMRNPQNVEAFFPVQKLTEKPYTDTT